MASIQDILAVASDPSHRREATVKILLREDLRNRHAELEADLVRKTEEFADNILKPDEVKVLAREVQAVEDEMEAASVEFRFRALPYRDWMALIAAHPPTAKQRKEQQHLDHNPDTFQPAAIAASCVEPEMSEEQASQMRDLLPFDAYLMVWGTCAGVNRGDGGPKASKLAGLILRRNGSSEGQPTTTGSLEASSSDVS